MFIISQANWSKRKILIIEDDPECILLIREVFAATGIQILAAQSGREGQRLLAGHPDVALVLLDIRLPDIDGFAVLKHIRNINRGQWVIAMTAMSIPEIYTKCQASGFNGFLLKPFDMRKLIETVHTAMEYTCSFDH